ncbi:MAG: MFS transporter [Akkermansiaceae bacterium]|nr:MFS transporter [Akkermansiaceae bacterium]
MEIECSKCHCKFESSKEDVDLCPDCLRTEFSVQARELDATEREELMAEYKASLKRQSARAEMMGSMYASGQAFSVAGKLRFALGFVIFIICGFLFLISDKNSGVTFLAELDIESQRMFSMILCVVSAVLVAFSSVRFRGVVMAVALVILGMGWFLPNMLQAAIKEKERLEAEAAAKAQMEAPVEDRKESTDRNGPILTEEDLQVFYTLRTPSHRISHYAVFIDNQDSRARSLVREALNRLLEAEYTRAYTRANGALYVATNVPKVRRNISNLLTRFGTVTYAEPEKGVYEVRFDADRANLVSQYSSEVLTSPMNNSYVTANLSELRCLDSMRVRMSARSLAASNVNVLRGEIRDTLVDVLQEPWATDPDTYAALIDALVTYSKPKDAQTIKLCYDYFEARRVLKRDVSPDVTHYLIREIPDAMVNPIIDFWCENPITWGEMLNQLGYRVQAPLLERLSSTKNIRLITAILKYLQDRGTSEALPAVEPFLEYPDSIIRHSARATISDIKSRSH